MKHFTRHDLASLQADIKNNAYETREDRIAARELSGPERHWALEDAKDNNSRVLLLAYGILRGRTFAQMESEHSDPQNLPDWGSIQSTAEQYAPKASEDGPDLEAILVAAEADYKAWHRQLIQGQMLRAAQQRAA